MRKLAFVTSSRADFGKMYPLIASAKALGSECHVFCTGAHYREHMGSTYIHVRQMCKDEGWHYHPWYIDDGPLVRRVADVSVGVRNLLFSEQMDLLVIHGDRAEALGAALTALDGQRVAHVEGGEITSTADEITRHAITKLAHWHLVSSQVARNRVLQMGECKDSVFVIGSPDMDVLSDRESRPELKDVFQRYSDLKKIDVKRGYGIVIYHPVSFYTDEQQADAARAVADALLKPKQWIVIGANDDPGWQAVNSSMRRAAGKNVVFIPSMRFEYFITLLENSELILGNSSCGIMEAPSLGVQTINVGPRQDNRAKEFGIRSIANVQDTTSSEIVHAIDTYWGRKLKSDFSFGEGESAYKFAGVLASNDAWAIKIQKQFVPRICKDTAKYAKRKPV